MDQTVINDSSISQRIPILLLILLLLLSSVFASATHIVAAPINFLLPTDDSALLAFKESVVPGNKLNFIMKKTLDYYQWVGVKCGQGKMVHLVLEDLGLEGTFSKNTLGKLDQLRVLIFKYNNLMGPIPNLSLLFNLKTLFIDHNSFTGTFPPLIFSLHRIKILDLSNNFTRKIPDELATLDRLYYLRLKRSRFNGTILLLKQSSLKISNVSSNNVTGLVPITLALSSFNSSSSFRNPGLCGQIIGRISIRR